MGSANEAAYSPRSRFAALASAYFVSSFVAGALFWLLLVTMLATSELLLTHSFASAYSSVYIVYAIVRWIGWGAIAVPIAVWAVAALIAGFLLVSSGHFERGTFVAAGATPSLICGLILGVITDGGDILWPIVVAFAMAGAFAANLLWRSLARLGVFDT